MAESKALKSFIGKGNILTSIYSLLKVGFPKMYWFGKEGDYNILVMELLGKNLEEEMKVCGKKFSLKTILIIAD